MTAMCNGWCVRMRMSAKVSVGASDLRMYVIRDIRVMCDVSVSVSECE